MVGYIASLRQGSPRIPQVDTSWVGGLADTIGGAMDQFGDTKLAREALGATSAAAPQQGGFFGRLMTGQQQAQPTQAGPPVVPVQRGNLASTDQMGQYRNAIASIESKGSGDYAAVGPTHPKMGRALGRYQIMETNIGPWSQEVLGRQVTPDEFMANPQLQDAIFDGKFGSYVSKYGPEGAAQAWLGGEGGVGKTGRRDSLGTSIGEYGNRFTAAVGGSGGAVDAVNTMAAGGQTAAYVDPAVSAPASRDPASTANAQPFSADAVPLPNSGSGSIIAPGVTPVQRGSVDTDILARMIGNPRLREMGIALWKQNSGQAAGEPWQFVNLPDGTLARANQQTGAVERLGTFAKAPEPKGLVNAGDGQLYDQDSKEWLSAPNRGQKKPDIVELFDEATGLPYKARWDDQTGEFVREGGVKAQNGMAITTNPDGTVSITQGAGRPPKLTEAEGKNSGFLVRANDSQKILNTLEGQGTSLWNKTVGAVPVIGNFARSEDAQKYDQAKRDFINAQLRRESGAVISPEEFANAEQQYFPQPGDGPQVIEQKRANRQNAIRGLEIGAGAGLDAASQPSVTQPSGQDAAAPLQSARDAIARGADREAVIRRLREAGIEASGL
ncbi:hypothetical protein LH464_21305 [Neorhizobium sp. T786]|uniref:hypothetical protein n=1 Tax=Pseudorhizobium xiangyangii TaxID=2883104 RepID=UPI001D00171C|nr:hypothetical protein [Neorhizobium xiangyangii]MCB5205007.1 hypothetical protein [Neorhizobium xiangyangii]